MSKQTITLTTDAEGKFNASDSINDPVWGMTVKLKATLVTPPALKLSGTFALGANPPREFTVATDEPVDLGAWKVAHGANAVSAAGTTDPAAPNTTITVEFEY